ncbi:hypothetical protein GGR54DRAFT_7047 [Hypoxylon sp. NC1633]|nr:hypothetical protein GGR54DRAFT_7047 [Hypoxylon sp. NC1633]
MTSTDPERASHSSDSDNCSDTSSVIYIDQEPFDTFRFRVLALAVHKLFGPNATADEISVERMEGGGFNRVIGVSRQPVLQQDDHVRYILRIPRFDDQQLGSQVATLQFLHQRSKIPVPEVISFDEMKDNELGCRYIVQNRIPGTPLISTYPKLTHEERCRVARELGKAYCELLATRSDVPGVLVLPVDDVAHPLLQPWQCTSPSSARKYSYSSTYQDIHKMLADNFAAQKSSELKERPNAIIRPHLMDRFSHMTSGLLTGGWLTNCHISLAHLDLEPHNILVNSTPDTDLPIISAILDWDSAVFSPQFMCCKPPLWLWAWLDDEDEDERTANDEPPSPENQRIKQIFEEAAGPDYLRFSYAPAYRLARKLVRFAIDGLHSNEDYCEAELMLEEWEAIRNDAPGSSPKIAKDLETIMEDKAIAGQNEGTAACDKSTAADQDENDSSLRDESQITRGITDRTTMQNHDTATWHSEVVTLRQQESTSWRN